METKVYKIRGSHRDERRIRQILGHDPDIHSGLAGRGAFCAHLTEKEHKLLLSHEYKVSKKPIRG